MPGKNSSSDGDSKKKILKLSSEDSAEDPAPDDISEGDETTSPQSTVLAEVQQLKEALEKAKSDMLYLQADFDNFRKQTIKERSDLVKYGSERLLREILSIVDIFDQALKAELTEENVKSFREGMDMTAAELKKVLNRFGVTQVESLGKNFDPMVHEALGSEPTDQVPPGAITKVFKEAYKLHDRVIRPAQVIVASEAQKSEPTQSD